MRPLVLTIAAILIVSCSTQVSTPTAVVKPVSSPTIVTTKAPATVTPTVIVTSQPTSSTQVQAKVVRVIDGDTIEVEIGGKKYTVRYIGIDTPETVDPRRPVQRYGQEASQKNKELVEGKVVALEKDISETDRYGRLLRYVYVDSLFVNAELVRLGYAQVATFPPDVKYKDLFLRMQQEARESKRGLWSEEGIQDTPPKLVPTTAPAPPKPMVTVAPTTKPAPTTTAAPALSGGFDPKQYIGQGDRYSCSDFKSQANAQSVLRADPRDPNRLDSDKDGIACESNPSPYDRAPVPSP